MRVAYSTAVDPVGGWIGRKTASHARLIMMASAILQQGGVSKHV